MLFLFRRSAGMLRGSPFLGLFPIAALIAGCLSDTTDGASSEEIGAPSPGPVHGLIEVATQPRLSVPLQSDDSTYFHLVSSGAILSDGSIAIADRGRDEVLVFDRVGRFEHAFGGKGDGPGEFNSLSRMTVRSSDTLEVWESLAARSAAYGADGTLYWDKVGPAGRVSRVSEWFVAPGGAVFALKLDRGSVTPPTGVVRAERPLVRWHAPDEIDTLEVFRGPSRMFIQAGRPFSEPIPTLFGADVEAAAGGKPWRLAVGDGALPEFIVLDSLGRHAYTTSWDPRRWRLDDRAVAAERGRRIKEEMGRGRDPRQAAATIGQLPAPLSHPVFRDLFVDEVGHVWVELYPEPGSSFGVWSVFASGGVWEADVRLPRGAHLLHVDEHQILTRAIDSLGVHTVQLFDLEWPTEHEPH